MNGYLVDTNIPSGLREKPNARVVRFLRDAGRNTVFLSVMTIGEICKGIAGLPSGQKRATLQEWLDHDPRSWFAGRVLPVTESLAERWRQLAAAAKQRGSTLAVVDGVIAATALDHDLILITRNLRDFADLGINSNPWEA